MNEYREAASTLSAHTPGPWLWHGTRGDLLIGEQCGPVSTILDFDGCTVFRDSEPAAFEATIEANKRLISAAPEMFEALLMAEDFLSGFEGDEAQEGIDEKIAFLKCLIAKVGGNQI